ncbi:MAG: hypothetical protein ACREP4_13825 [Stenotrophomonas sp.]|uniref:hypothetical protein n=1 Tax=Stenotrophomonas sp. TaxID=69392 RepID=UPI003D6D1A9C
MRNTLVFLFAGSCAALLVGCGNGKLADAQRTAVASMSKQLPAPYRDGLIIDSVHRHGDDLVQMIRSPDATVDMAKAKPELFEQLRVDEDNAITELCADKVLLPVYEAGGGVRRRFIDANGAVFFEVTLKSSHCISP